MIYEYLPQAYRDDVLAGALLDREQEWFHYEFDRKNFELMAVLAEGEYAESLRARIAAIELQQVNVTLLLQVLRSQITDPEQHAAAVSRVLAKRAKEQAS